MLVVREPLPQSPYNDPASGCTCQMCDSSHHCGPFMNQGLYDSYPGWSGHADCACCGSTIRVSCVCQAA